VLTSLCEARVQSPALQKQTKYNNNNNNKRHWPISDLAESLQNFLISWSGKLEEQCRAIKVTEQVQTLTILIIGGKKDHSVTFKSLSEH
jgi:hypothetical protein